MRATVAIIHLENLRHNIRTVRRHIGSGTRLCMAVKADAYGHGAVRVSQTALEEGIEFLGVATVDEGSELRAAGISAPVILLGLPDSSEIPRLVRDSITPFVADSTLVNLLSSEAARQKRRTAVHLKVDTGMGRIGCLPEDAPALARLIRHREWLRLEGLATHFPVADSDASPFTDRQIEILAGLRERFAREGVPAGIVHAANSGAIISHHPALFDMARPGIMLYGYYPSHDQKRTLDLRPVMELKTKISFIKRVPAGTGISYGLTYTAQRATRIATLPVGYADGYSRLLSNRASVLIRGRRFPVAGRVCMDQTMVDLGDDSSVDVNDDVILFGGPGAPDAEKIAGLMGTIPYEVTCLVTRRVPRVYTDTDADQITD